MDMITFDGLVAGEKFLRQHNQEFDDGTPDGTHWLFIRQLLSEVFRASGTALEMPDKRPDTPLMISSAAHQETGRLLVFLAEPGDADCEQGFFCRHD